MKTTIYIAASLVILAACGTENPSNEVPSAGTDSVTAQDIATDSELASEDISSQVDDSITAIMADGGMEAASYGLAGPAETKAKRAEKEISGERKESRDCKMDEASGSTTVSIEREMSRERTFTLRNVSFKMTQSASDVVTRVWTKAGALVPCNEAKTHIKLPESDREGLKLAATFSRDASSATTFTKKDVTTTRSRSKTAKGTHNVSWLSVKEEADKVIINKEVSFSLDKTIKVVDKEGKERTAEAAVKTKDGAPLTVEILRNKASGEVEEREVISGTVVATKKDGSRVELSYDKVVYTAEGHCQASSGKILGAVFAKDATEPTTTFIIDFAAEEQDVTMKDGTKAAFDVEGCDLDQPAKESISKKG